MSTMVSARIPSEVYAQGIKKLKDMNSCVTDLVRAAFDYVIATGKLPTEDAAMVRPGMRSFSKEQASRFNSMFYGSSEPIDLSDDLDYKNSCQWDLDAEYEALS